MALLDIPPFSGDGNAEETTTAGKTKKTRLVNNQNDSGSPISRLPVELMCRIFSFVRDGSMYHMSRNIGDWAWVSHVCHRWRAIALGEPALWTDPPLHLPEWTRLCLERSKQAGLTVELRTDTLSEVITMVSKHISHISKLTVICANLDDMAGILVEVLGAAAPFLQTLSLEMHHWIFNDSTDPADMVRPDDILASFLEAPRLRHLKLYGLSLPWDSPLLSSLTSLCLEDVHPARRPSLAQLREILESTPKLKALKLYSALPQPTHAVIGGANCLNRVGLPYLETLALTGTLPQLLQFSDMVALSANIASINITVEHTGELKVGRLVADLTEAYRDEYYLTRVSLERFSSETLDPVDLVFRPDVKTYHCPYTGKRTARLKVSLNTDNKTPRDFDVVDTMDDYEAIYDPFFRCFSWNDLMEFRMNCLPFDALPSARAIASTFGSFHGVKTVVVSFSTIHLFMEILAPKVADAAGGRDSDDSGDGTARTDVSIPFPGLRHLRLVRVAFFSGAREINSPHYIEGMRRLGATVTTQSPISSPVHEAMMYDETGFEDEGTADEDEDVANTDANASSSHPPENPGNADSESEHSVDEEDDDFEFPADVDEFLKCLAGRKRLGAPIRCLSMVNCTVEDEDRQALRGAVDKVEWEEFPLQCSGWFREDNYLDPFSG